MTSNRKIEANRRNSRKSGGPRTAAGKSKASRNALRHGLTAVTCRCSVPPGEIEQFAKALCGDANDPVLFAQAVKIAENEMALQAICAQQVAVIERLREPYVVPFANKDNGLELGRARFMEGWLAEWEIEKRLPAVLEKYKDQMPPLLKSDEKDLEWLQDVHEIVPLRLKVLLDESDPDKESNALELAKKQVEEQERDDHEALAAAVPDLIRLERYQRRAWSRQKRAIRQFIALRV
jgi:hypothetical protein